MTVQLNFVDLNLDKSIEKTINKMGFQEPTLIQQKCIPLISKGKDVIGEAKTGSGKTAAFGFPIIQKILPKKRRQVLIITPTRELCLQVSSDLRIYAQYTPLKIVTIHGGVSYNPQLDGLQKAEIVVATPGRLLDIMKNYRISFPNLTTLVIDEADNLFDMGFLPDMKRIIRQLPRKRQTLLFSATIPENLLRLMNPFLSTPKIVRIDSFVEEHLLKQGYIQVSGRDKESLLIHLLNSENVKKAIVFCATRHGTMRLTKTLKKHVQAHVKMIHGGMSQAKRTQTIAALEKGHVNILVATDVASRGLDISNITNIYNFDLPRTKEGYIHRIGRTARAGKKGFAITLFDHQEARLFNKIIGNQNVEPLHYPRFKRIAVTGRYY